MTRSSMTRRMAATAVFSLLCVSLGAPGALAADWEFLGSRSVRLAGDVDVIPVGASEGKFKSVQLRVKDNGIFMEDMRITFSNGDQKDVRLRTHIAEGERTRRIDLPGKARRIRSVRLIYRSVADSDGRATVQLWGLQ
ncbi:MAG TPA: hypothetical protein VLA52_09675 [Thermohalobaculum sp.]|nr:hypothetical protein [Thermohalobaculum sp.]